MSAIPFVVPQKSGKKHLEKLKKKLCAFPGCKEKFMGTGKSKFCKEHRLRKYRKTIDAGKIEAKKVEEESKSANQVIKHNFKESTLIKICCKLEGCGKEFDIKLFPNVTVYPRFCKDHRNEWKRELFLKQRS